jgi:hypothetical protein
LSRLVHCSREAIAIQTYPSRGNASYIVDGRIGLYIKHSTKRLSPWTFTFQGRHQDEILEMHRRFADVLAVFVCHTDGIACLTFAELQVILGTRRTDVQWVRISRRPREKYAIAGGHGRLKSKIGDNEFPRKLFAR